MEAEKDMRFVEELLFRRQWYIQLSGPSFPGVRTREAILPNLNDWIERKHGSVSFHLTQLLTGHGCFNSYLYKIGKADSPICAHCGREHDTAEHTLQACTTWSMERNELKKEVGHDLSLGVVVGAMIALEKTWAAAIWFAETVMLAKEVAERARQMAGLVGGQFSQIIIEDDSDDD
ncbi:unnamed protein product [Lasius platythorax]|uniref:Reverse transcriptase n=1 Tax=Lasius platythorax TaxID=488582 RepID=A0AAV2P7B6_9HYME